jgi:GT2 family glycosyltransferase
MTTLAGPFDVEVIIVTYRSDIADLERLVGTLEAQQSRPFRLRVTLVDNTADPAYYARLERIAAAGAPALAMETIAMPRNVGFGTAVNRVLRDKEARYVLLLNPDAYLAPDALAELARRMEGDERAAAWEMRQSPYEHPKIYDPVTLETPWVSTAAVLYRRAALDAIGGFDEKIFLYGEDVDVSWRLRCRGWLLRYVPRSVAIHRTYQYPGEVKAQQVLGGTLTNLCLRARFARWRRVAGGVRLMWKEIGQPEIFPGRRRGLIANLLKFALLLPRFRIGPWRNIPGFEPYFVRWDYAPHREGAFFEFREPGAWKDGPRVSILIRTHRRPHWLREALQTVRSQTYPNIEAVVVEDGEPISKDMIEREFAGTMNVRYAATGERVGRSSAGNLAMSMANGEWFNFLDDDDVLFADHVEVMVSEALRLKVMGVYGIALETPTRVTSTEPLRYAEVEPFVRYRQPFSRLALWHHDFIPIQALLFHRSLFDAYGGFDEAMDQLEDWNLWTRYTLEEDFALVEKTTSKYRVPADPHAAQERQASLDAAYAGAIERQASMRLAVTPREVMRWLSQHERR